jgi:GNAT superfamily N-acetyltransferase
VRAIARDDFVAWESLWNGYNAFYGRSGATALPELVTRTTWSRFLAADEPVHALVAESDGRVAGLAHYLFHRSTTQLGPSCYLQDLFTSDAARGRGVGRALIAAVAERARAAGAQRLEADTLAVIALWEACGLTRSWNDPRKDIARKLAVQREWFLVGTVDDRVVASVMAGYDGHRGWVNYLAVAPGERMHGRGRALMDEVERLLREAGCAKVNLQVRSGNAGVIEFYRRLGYAQDDVVSLGRRLIADE